jgi:hypothetical protein
MMADSFKEPYYSRILDIAQDYLGPAAERFLSRQMRLHFKKDPHQLQKADIPMLAIRIRSGLLVLTHDESVVEEAFRRITEVADKD